MFLEDADGELINTANIVWIKQVGDEGQELSAQAKMQDGTVFVLKRSMLDIKELLTDIIPAAPGFYLLLPGGGEREAIIAWKRLHYGLIPVTLSTESSLNYTKGCAVLAPDGSVFDLEDDLPLTSEKEWDEYCRDRVRRVIKVAEA